MEGSDQVGIIYTNRGTRPILRIISFLVDELLSFVKIRRHLRRYFGTVRVMVV